ncbi:hypothetical protein ABK040_009740 [Willaertia magna]
MGNRATHHKTDKFVVGETTCNNTNWNKTKKNNNPIIIVNPIIDTNNHNNTCPNPSCTTTYITNNNNNKQTNNKQQHCTNSTINETIMTPKNSCYSTSTCTIMKVDDDEVIPAHCRTTTTCKNNVITVDTCNNNVDSNKDDDVAITTTNLRSSPLDINKKSLSSKSIMRKPLTLITQEEAMLLIMRKELSDNNESNDVLYNTSLTESFIDDSDKESFREGDNLKLTLLSKPRGRNYNINVEVHPSESEDCSNDNEVIEKEEHSVNNSPCDDLMVCSPIPDITITPPSSPAIHLSDRLIPKVMSDVFVQKEYCSSVQDKKKQQLQKIIEKKKAKKSEEKKSNFQAYRSSRSSSVRSLTNNIRKKLEAKNK